ncbi:MAG: Crp/Fnr family transcriptional regulator [Bacteroidota bacterium]
MDELRIFLKQFDSFEEKELDEALARFSEVTVKKNDFYIKEEEVAQKVAFIKKGLFKLYYNIDGAERIMLFFQENQFVTDYYSFLTQTPSKRPIQAIEDALIYNISYNDFQKLYDTGKKWERLGRMLAERAYIFSVQRANRIIHDDPDTRFITFLKEYPTLIQRIPQYMIASYLSMTPETYSRIKKRIDLKDVDRFTPIHDPYKKDFI